ncbi:tetratricopeptide repeat protein 28-like [Oculina patagonica]
MVFHSIGECVKAKEYLEKALAINKEIGDRKGEATSYGNLGNVFQSLSEYAKAKEHHEKALAINKEIGHRNGEAACNGNLGNALKSLGEYVKAKDYYEKALAISVEIDNREGEAVNYGNLGTVFKYFGEYVKAKEYFEKALAISVEIGYRNGEAAYHVSLGTVFQSLGEYVKAKEYHEKALAINKEIGVRSGEATNYGNLGTVFQSLGEYVKAKEYYEKALAINKEIGDRNGEAINYVRIGVMFHSLGEHVKAKEYLEKALVTVKEIGDKESEVQCYISLGTVFNSLGQYRKSKQYLDKALAIVIKTGDRLGEATCYGNLGNLFLALGDHVKPKEHYEKALAIGIEIGCKKTEAVMCHKLGNLFQSLGDYVTAEEYLEKALSLSKDIRFGEIEFDCCCNLTFTKYSQGKIEEALTYLFQSIEKCEELRGFNADNDQIKISLADEHAFPYLQLSALLCTSGNFKDALYAVELGRARALADLMATQYSAETRISAIIQSWFGIKNVIKKERNCSCLYISYNDTQVLLWLLKTSGAIHFRKITVDKKTLHTRLAKIATNLDRFFAIMATSFRSFGILPEELCEDRSLNDFEPESDSSREENLAALRQGKDEDDPNPSLTLFHEMLIDPVSDLLKEPEIIIVPDRRLYRVPFPAILDKEGKFLSETFRIRVVPSLTTLRLIQDSPADYHSQTGVLIMGDPDVGDVMYCGSLNRKFVPLPGARKEAEMIGRLLGVQPLLGQHATKQAVLQRINSMSLIHLAAHGNAERGEIALAPLRPTTGIPQEEDYLLKMSDISQIQLRAKLVILSCCHSGRGQIRAEGVVGIARAFLGSGARSVLVALWALEDSATLQLMSRFYEHLVRGESASESLHEAMKWMRENGYSDVKQWAPFMLIGDNVTFDFGK